jgi:hypothetical protein
VIAERFNDPERACQVRGEIEFVTDQLTAAVGLGGRDRTAASHAERARVLVTQSIKAAIKKRQESSRFALRPMSSGHSGSWRANGANRTRP